MSKEAVREFLKNQHLAVVSTADLDTNLEASLVYFIADECFNIFFLSKTETTKVKNINKNPKVAIVIGLENKPKSIKASGTAEVVNGSSEYADIKKRLINRITERSNYWPPLNNLDKGSLTLVKITPTSMSYYDATNFGNNAATEEEVYFKII